MRLARRLKSLEVAAERARPGGEPDECTRVVRSCPTTARMIVRCRAWIARGDARAERMIGVIQDRVARLRALRWPRGGLGDELPEECEA